MTQIIGWAIIHSLWQAGGLALLLAVALHLTRRATPVLRYRLAVVAMLGSLVIPVATVMTGEYSWHDVGRTVWLPGAAGTPVADIDAAPPPTAMESPSAVGMLADRERPGTVLAELRARVDALLPLIVALWAGGLLVFTARLAGGLAGVRRLASAPDVSPLPPRLAAAATRLAARLRVRATIPIRVSARVNVPVVVGYVRPLILLPVSLVTGLPPAQLEALIAHELAHVRRHDVLVNLVQRVIETAMFYHPAVWWISARVRDERESCCDADAVRACRGDVASYASALLALEEMHDGRLITVLAASHGPLLRRIERLVHGRAAGAELGARWVGGTLGLLAVL
ncbi:MAG TPA: M56 family metallopeptidase, partial [Gemmatimonadaceae bacterium]